MDKTDNVVSADTSQLKYISNKNDVDFTKEYFTKNFAETLDKARLIQKSLNDIMPDNCMGVLQSIDDIWADDEILTAETFIINLSLTQNRLQKKVNCIFVKKDIE